MKIEAWAQLDVLDAMGRYTVTGRAAQWVYVSAHFTQDAADAFISRKAHDYRNGMRVYVESQVHSWEFNAVKQAIMDGRLKLVEGGVA